MAIGLYMAKVIQRGGSAWRDPDAWSVRFDSTALIDHFTIRNTGNLAEKLSMSMEEADALVDFIQEVKKAHAKWLKHRDLPLNVFVEDDTPVK
jgi:hypothetical protein